MENIFVILILLLFTLCLYNNIEEGFTQEELYKNLMKDFKKIFPDMNRNAGGPQFYHHIVSMNPSREEFIKYNTFYCAVSGSPIDPNRDKTYDNIVVNGLDGKKYYGKYYRCCWPCLCDIMRKDTVYVEPFTVKLKDGDYDHYVLTINDPCLNYEKIPEEISSFKCDKMTQNGIHSNSGRLIIGVLHDVEPYKNQDVSEILNMCKERMNTPVDELKGGMGDISVKLYTLGF
tara:strand:+ start:479 stop:1171 length:693 start_codon:yes stop_codon:yes gene_type:complete